MTKAQPDQPERPYHHGQLVKALLVAAVELIEAQGVEAWSLRDVSRRVGVSPGAPFRHFKSKADPAGGRRPTGDGDVVRRHRGRAGGLQELGAAYVCGLARMAVNGEFPQWNVTGDTKDAVDRALAFYIAMLSAPSPSVPKFRKPRRASASGRQGRA